MKYIEYEVGNYPHGCNVEEISSNPVGALNIFHACPDCNSFGMDIHLFASYYFNVSKIAKKESTFLQKII